MPNYTYTTRTRDRINIHRNTVGNSRVGIILFSAGILIFISLFVQLYVMSMFATQGGIVEEYQLKKEQLLTENKALQQEIAQARNLDYIRKESEKVGYVDINAKEVQYLNVE